MLFHTGPQQAGFLGWCSTSHILCQRSKYLFRCILIFKGTLSSNRGEKYLKLLTSILNAAGWLPCSNTEAEVWHLLQSRNTWPVTAWLPEELVAPFALSPQKVWEVLVWWWRAAAFSHRATLLGTAAKWMQFGWRLYLILEGAGFRLEHYGVIVLWQLSFCSWKSQLISVFLGFLLSCFLCGCCKITP